MGGMDLSRARGVRPVPVAAAIEIVGRAYQRAQLRICLKGTLNHCCFALVDKEVALARRIEIVAVENAAVEEAALGAGGHAVAGAEPGLFAFHLVDGGEDGRDAAANGGGGVATFAEGDEFGAVGGDEAEE